MHVSGLVYPGRRAVEAEEADVEAREPRAALADVFWAILNGAEFALNH